ncbi:MAG: hypothetical protein WBA07_11810 [Rivularia sp. (in: cyanobacteria)]
MQQKSPDMWEHLIVLIFFSIRQNFSQVFIRATSNRTHIAWQFWRNIMSILYVRFILTHTRKNDSDVNSTGEFTSE